MSQNENSVFVLVLDCMDGRTKGIVIEKWIEERIAPLFPGKTIEFDTITAPGMDRLLATGDARVEQIRKDAEISRDKHGAEMIIIIGHEDCAGNPVVRHHHIGDLKKARVTVQPWGFKRIFGVYAENLEKERTNRRLVEMFDSQI